MTEAERLYRNEKTFNYAKKNDQFYIKNNNDDDKEQNFESFESFENENEKFNQKEENQDKSQIVLHQMNQNSSNLYSAYYS